MNKLIDEHFREKDFDLRKKKVGYSRYMDQKVTPDVISFISDCILNLPNPQKFSVNDIWNLKYFEQNIKAIFGKPAPSNKTSHAEYNKFIGQPLKTLAYAGVLDEFKIGHTNYYSINNPGLLEYIAQNERAAFDFLSEYVTKVLSDSGFIKNIYEFQKQISTTNNKNCFDELKKRFQRFMLGNTAIKGITEINRIFPKILNLYAVKHNIPGSEKGKCTRDPFTFSDLMYNRTNFRDLLKSKGSSRKEAVELLKATTQKNDYQKYRISKATQLIRKKYSSSEVRDQWAKGTATQVHHIFPQSNFPEFAAYPENLIKLTPEQHFNKAHQNANTGTIDRSYQIQCLLAKCNNIKFSLNSGEFIYSKDAFINLINKGMNLTINPNSDFDEINRVLNTLLKSA
jgi:hypothetical protein